MRPSVFISRSIERSRSFISMVETACGTIVCESLIDFSIKPSTGLPKQGWLFFYSQSGIDFFFKQHSPSDVISNGLNIGVFGPKSGMYMASLGLTPKFIGTGEANSTAQQFLALGNVDQVCFVKGSTSKDSIRPFLEEHAEVSCLEVYDNRAKVKSDIPRCDILAFTSPLNLETYFSKYSIQPGQKIVVIGTSTAISALNLRIDEVHIAPAPSLESIATIVLGLCETWNPSE